MKVSGLTVPDKPCGWVASVHLNNDHANKNRIDGRTTLANFFILMLRDQVDLVSGDWDQGGGYLGECVKHAVRFHERANPGTRVRWSIQGHTENPGSLFNWQVNGEPIPMAITTKDNYKDLSVRDFGLRGSDTDTHTPQFFLIRKHPDWSYQSSHTQSQAGIEREAKSRKLKRQRQRQQAAAEARAAQPGVYSKARGSPQATTGTRRLQRAPSSSSPTTRVSWA